MDGDFHLTNFDNQQIGETKIVNKCQEKKKQKDVDH